MSYHPPLHVNILFHPESERAAALAESLLPSLVAAPATHAMRVPTFLTPDRGDGLPPPLDGVDGLDLSAAARNLVVILVDARMVRRNGSEWGVFLEEMISRHRGPSCRVLPVALDHRAFELHQEIGERLFLLLSEASVDELRTRLLFHMAVHMIGLLRNLPAPDVPPREVEAPVTVFASHAKRDLDTTHRDDPVRYMQDSLRELPVREWFDAREIRPGDRFEERIRSAIRKCDIFALFLTDAWACSQWCRWEAVIAKEEGKPILAIDALEEGEPRSFPYGGNVRTLRWRVGLGQPPDPERIATCEAEAKRVLAAAVHETARRQHTLRLMETRACGDETALDSPPEAVHLAFHPSATTFLHPDPPLTREEQDVLDRLRPGVRIETPLSRAATRLCREPPLAIAVSVSDSEMLHRYGLRPHHLRMVTDEIHLYLLVAGLRIVYGGKLDPDKLDDPDNFTCRLFNLAEGYSPLAKDIGAAFQPILNAAPWPLWALYSEEVLDHFGRLLEVDKVPCPDLGFPLTDLGLQPSDFTPPDTPLRRYAWARALTEMRTQVTQSTVARLCIGGKIEGYKGRYPGLLEEPLLSLRSGHPLFLVGAMGGCTRLVIDLLEGRDREEMSATSEAAVAGQTELKAAYAEHGGDLHSREELAAELTRLGKDGPAAALNNGLTDEENRELFHCTEAARIAELVLTGLDKLA